MCWPLSQMLEHPGSLGIHQPRQLALILRKRLVGQFAFDIHFCVRRILLTLLHQDSAQKIVRLLNLISVPRNIFCKTDALTKQFPPQETVGVEIKLSHGYRYASGLCGPSKIAFFR